MRNFLLRVHTGGTAIWQIESLRRWAKLGGFLAIAFLSFVGINLIFGSRGAAQAISEQFRGNNGILDQANLPFDYQFIGQGRITGGTDDSWMIGNIPVLVGQHTQLNSELHAGDFVTLSGRILENEQWLADQIELTQEGESFFTFNGPLKWMRGIFWGIGGHSLVTDQRTRLGDNLAINDLLMVTFTVLDNGGWLALEIKRFDEFPIDQASSVTPIQTISPINTPAPAYNSGEESKPSDRSGKKRDPGSKPGKDKGSRGKSEAHRKNNK